MANGVDGDPRREKDQDHERRRAFEDAFLALHPDVAERLREDLEAEGWDIRSTDEALYRLAEADVPRVLKHRLLISGFRAAPRRMPDYHEPVREVLESTLPDEGVDTSHAGRAALDTLRGLAVHSGEARLEHSHWQRWVAECHQYFDFGVHERTFRACDDRREVPKLNVNNETVRSRRIVAEFWSDLQPADFVDYINPEKWPDCSSAWEAVTALEDKRELDDRGGYNGVFEERVRILTEVLAVPLEIGMRVPADGSAVWTRFNIARRYWDSAPVDVDTGRVSAERKAGGPAPTLVRATKYLHWADNRTDLSGLACDLGYVELMLQMASRCQRGPQERRPTPGAGAPRPGQAGPRPSAEDAVARLVDGVTGEWKRGINRQAPHLRRLLGRFTGATWNLRWINDLLDMSRVAVDTSGDVANHVRRFADDLSALDDRETPP